MFKINNIKKSKALATVLFLLVIIIGGYYLFNRKVRFVRYPAFGIDVPVNYKIHGIDVSHYQADIDWNELEKMKIGNIKIGFCFIKATEGTETLDDKFEKNWIEAKKNNIVRGAYHFFNPNKSGTQQAQQFIETVRLDSGDLPPVLDVEQIKGKSLPDFQQEVQNWLTAVEGYYQVQPIIYTNADFYERNLAGKFDSYPLWVAHYLIKDKPRIQRNWIFWQHNDGGHVNGIDAFVDFNVFEGDSIAFKKLLLK